MIIMLSAYPLSRKLLGVLAGVTSVFLWGGGHITLHSPTSMAGIQITSDPKGAHKFCLKVHLFYLAR